MKSIKRTGKDTLLYTHITVIQHVHINKNMETSKSTEKDV